MPTGPDTVAELTRRLTRHEAALLAIPGVTGCGIGLAAHGPSRPVIQVFVAERAATATVTRAVSAVLGTSPFDVVEMPPPSADARRPKAPDRSREDP